MTLFQAIVLGIIQGLTEFLPVSSSAHLVLVPYLARALGAGWPNPPVVFDVVVHFATLVALLVFMSNDVKKLVLAFFDFVKERRLSGDPYRKLSLLILGGSAVTLAMYLVAGDLVEQTLNAPRLVAFFLIITGLLLLGSERFPKKDGQLQDVRFSDSLVIGLFQGIALFPGISRSGSTISAGLFRGLSRETAARFSFLLAIPIILGGTLEALTELVHSGAAASLWGALGLGFIAALISGLFAMRQLLRYLKHGRLNIFAYYCFAVGLIALVLTSIS